jgi:hypothetical protein
MCEGKRLIAHFVAGTDIRPNLPEVLEEHLTATADGLWVVWAYKLARQVGDLFVPLTGRPGYPADATATCRLRRNRGGHDAPYLRCTCGFHAVSSPKLPGLPIGHPDFSMLTVALSGRVLAFEWAGGGVLWRAERQTVVRVEQPAQRYSRLADLCATPPKPTELASVLGIGRGPADPDGRPAVVRPVAPRDSGPIRLSLPASSPVLTMRHDDAGWCVGTSAPERSQTFEYTSASLVSA